MKKTIVFVIMMIVSVSVFCFSACSGNSVHEHIFSLPEVIRESDCRLEGVKSYTCSDCGFVKIESIPKTSHNYTVFDEKPSSCVSNGYKVEKCEICGDVKYQSFQIVPHAYVSKINFADCINPETVEKVCSVCGYMTVETTSKALGHDYVLMDSIRSECGKPKVNIFSCARCDAEKHEPSSELSQHVFQIIGSIPASCSHKGNVTSKCLYCDAINVDESAPLEHSFVNSVIEPTCTNEGKIYKYCRNADCGFNEIISVLPKKMHECAVMNEGNSQLVYSRDGSVIYGDNEGKTVVSSAACFEIKDGLHFKCDTCNLSVSSSAHDKTVYDSATCVKGGSLIEKCAACGKVFSSSVSLAKGHDSSQVEFLCKEDEELSSKYAEIYGDNTVKICYICPRCGEYVKTISHRESCDIIQVTCQNPQTCLDCGAIIKTKEHVAPTITCISSKNDNYYYCVNCNIFAFGELTEHEYRKVSETPATCTENKVIHYKCVCGKDKTEKVENTKISHSIPDGYFPCKKSDELSAEYLLQFSVEKSIAYKCENCNQYVESVNHELSCSDSDVRCDNPQICVVCNMIFKTVNHVGPEFICVSEKNDGYYYCTSCHNYRFDEITDHVYNVTNEIIPATCKENEYVIKQCACGALDPIGRIENQGTKLGHKISDLSNLGYKDCAAGHAVSTTVYSCGNPGCMMNFAAIADENGAMYCLNLYNYFAENGYLDDYIYDPLKLKAGEKQVKFLFDCCADSQYHYIGVQHVYSSEPYKTEDYVYAGKVYKYISSTCATKGSALFKCENCDKVTYFDKSLPLDPSNHESKILACGKHCEKCAPDDENCKFAFVLNILDQNGNDVMMNGIPISASYSAAFMLNSYRTEVLPSGENEKLKYKLSEQFIAELEFNIGYICYNSVTAAKNCDSLNEFDWESVILSNNEENVVTVYVHVN